MQSFSLIRSLASKQTPSLFLRQHRAISSVPRIPSARFVGRPIQPPIRCRWNSSLAIPDSEATQQTERPREPSYQISFTCKPCNERSSHIITKHGYHKGTVLVKCPSCENRHVISDHLKIFMDRASTLEDILQRAAGEGSDISKLLKKGKLGMRQGEIVGQEGDEDIEFWEDGTETQHQPLDSKT